MIYIVSSVLVYSLLIGVHYLFDESSSHWFEGREGFHPPSCHPYLPVPENPFPLRDLFPRSSLPACSLLIVADRLGRLAHQVTEHSACVLVVLLHRG